MQRNYIAHRSYPCCLLSLLLRFGSGLGSLFRRLALGTLRLGQRLRRTAIMNYQTSIHNYGHHPKSISYRLLDRHGAHTVDDVLVGHAAVHDGSHARTQILLVLDTMQ